MPPSQLRLGSKLPSLRISPLKGRERRRHYQSSLWRSHGEGDRARHARGGGEEPLRHQLRWRHLPIAARQGGTGHAKTPAGECGVTPGRRQNIGSAPRASCRRGTAFSIVHASGRISMGQPGSARGLRFARAQGTCLIWSRPWLASLTTKCVRGNRPASGRGAGGEGQVRVVWTRAFQRLGENRDRPTTPTRYTAPDVVHRRFG
jgi:hypothetical protein